MGPKLAPAFSEHWSKLLAVWQVVSLPFTSPKRVRSIPYFCPKKSVFHPSKAATTASGPHGKSQLLEISSQSCSFRLRHRMTGGKKQAARACVRPPDQHPTESARRASCSVPIWSLPPQKKMCATTRTPMIPNEARQDIGKAITKARQKLLRIYGYAMNSASAQFSLSLSHVPGSQSQGC